MKKSALILALLCSEFATGIVSAQSSYNVEKVCYGPGRSAMVVEHGSRYYVVTSNNNITFTRNMLIADIPAISTGGQSMMMFAGNAGGGKSSYVDVITPGRFLRINNRYQRFMYSGLPGARSVCREIAYGL